MVEMSEADAAINTVVEGIIVNAPSLLVELETGNYSCKLNNGTFKTLPIIGGKSFKFVSIYRGKREKAIFVFTPESEISADPLLSSSPKVTQIEIPSRRLSNKIAKKLMRDFASNELIGMEPNILVSLIGAVPVLKRILDDLHVPSWDTFKSIKKRKTPSAESSACTNWGLFQ